MLFCVCLYEALMMSKINYCITPYGPDVLSETHVRVHRGQNSCARFRRRNDSIFEYRRVRSMKQNEFYKQQTIDIVLFVDQHVRSNN